MNKRLKTLVTAMALAWTATGALAKTTDSEVTRATLSNGLRVVIVQDRLAPVVTTEVNYLVGSNEVPKGFPGTAHAVEHMMFRGSPGLSKDQLAAITANLGGAFDAQTTQSVTQYYVVTPAQDLNVALHVESLRMRGANMDAADWKKERGAIEQEVSRDLSNPGFKFYSQLQAHLFKGTPYEHTPLGTRPSFNKTTAAMLKSFHDSWYAPNNAILVIAGDVDPQKTLAEIRELFASIPSRTLPARPAFHFQPVKAETIKLPTDSPYGSVYMAWRMPGTKDKDYATALVMANALGSQRADLAGMGFDGTALAGGFALQEMPRAGVGMAVGIFPRGGNPKPIITRMQTIMKRAVDKGIDPALVEAAKRMAIAKLEFEKNSVQGLANAWSNAVAFDGQSSPDSMKKAIEAVTPAKVDALAKATFAPAHQVTAVLTPQSSGKPIAGKGFGGSESFSSSPSKPVTLPDWASKALSRLSVPPSRLHPTTYTLDNGLKLIVQPESISNTVEVYGGIDTNEDLQAAKGEKGISGVLDRLYQFGTTHLDRLHFQRALDNISAKENAGASFSLAVPAEHFAQGMQLLADNELHPALPARAFTIVQHQEASATAGQIQSPDFLTMMGLDKALYPAHDPDLRYATPKSIDSLSLAKVKAYRDKAYRPDMTTIVVVGKITTAEAKKVVEADFGQWKAHGPKPKTSYPAVPPNKPGELHVPDSSASQDSVQLAQTVDVTYNDPTHYALQLGNQVLGGGFYASWLYRDLRDQSGLVYSVDTGFDFNKHRSTYSVSYGCDPKNVSKARALIVRDLKRLQDKPVPANDMERAKGLLLRMIPLSESSFGAIGGQLLQLSLEGRPLDAVHIAGEHYLHLTAKAVQMAFKQHVRPAAFVTAVKGPTPQ
ncbi:M16 family metallopeptidase [Mangrovitalea sediminis]|uniref:M16 family metallopeptidase n=1 Tax=Mangrovitalea sediminis TaxID=1982043 RepID=UPI000BE55099|nr:pitrilysin family protein [Mangrovitalea sediminis]